MRFVDDLDGSPVANARVSYCGAAWEGTLTGHGGKTHTLFHIQAATDARGELNLPPREFDSRPFGASTNYEHAAMLIVKSGYETYRLLNCCSALGELAAVSSWGYNGTTIRLKRSPPGASDAAGRSAADLNGCGQSSAVPVDPRNVAPSSQAPPHPVQAPGDPEGQHRRAAQPATSGR